MGVSNLSELFHQTLITINSGLFPYGTVANGVLLAYSIQVE